MKNLLLVSLLSIGLTTYWPAYCQAQSFAPIITYATGAYNTFPSGVEAADLNNDGYADLLTSNQNTSELAVLLNQKNGSFFPASTYSTGLNSRPNALAVGDINNDGFVDVVTSNGWAYKLTARLNNGGGTFGAYTDYYLGSSLSLDATPLDVALSDVNKDGYVDLITTVGGIRGSVKVLLNQQTGTFAPPVSYPAAGIEPTSMALADVNGDTYPDIVTVLRSDNQVEVLLNQQNGTFSAPVTYSAGTDSRPDGIALGDVDHDGYPDIITSNTQSSTAGVLRNQQNGTFGPVALYPIGAPGNPALSYTYKVAIGDINRDGFLDIAVTKGESDAIAVLLNKQDGTFGAPTTHATGLYSGPGSVRLKDVNNDGQLDLIVSNNQACKVGVLLNTLVLAVQSNRTTQLSAAIYPNPTVEKATLSYYLPAPTTVNVAVVDQTGRVVLRLAHNQPQGTGLQTLPIPALSAGLYTVRLVQDGKSTFCKFVVP